MTAHEGTQRCIDKL